MNDRKRVRDEVHAFLADEDPTRDDVDDYWMFDEPNVWTAANITMCNAQESLNRLIDVYRKANQSKRLDMRRTDPTFNFRLKPWELTVLSDLLLPLLESSRTGATDDKCVTRSVRSGADWRHGMRFQPPLEKPEVGTDSVPHPRAFPWG